MISAVKTSTVAICSMASSPPKHEVTNPVDLRLTSLGYHNRGGPFFYDSWPRKSLVASKSLTVKHRRFDIASGGGKVDRPRRPCRRRNGHGPLVPARPRYPADSTATAGDHLHGGVVVTIAE